jgi:uncharacterized membrane protein
MKVKLLARVLLGLALMFAGTGHLTFARQEFQNQVPSWVPADPDVVVIASGLVEIALGFGLIFLPKLQKQFGMAAALFFLAVFPGNIAQYLNHADAFGLNSDEARAIRLLFQPLLMIWALWSTNWQIKKRPRQESNLRPRD